MKIYCMRHGQVSDVVGGMGPALSDLGAREITNMAHFLKRQGVDFSHVLHSEKTRAVQTADIMTTVVNPGLAMESNELLTVAEDVITMASDVEQWSDDTLLVGHLPMMQELVSMLCLRDPLRLSLSFIPGTIVCLERQQQQRWVIAWLLSPAIVGTAEVS